MASSLDDPSFDMDCSPRARVTSAVLSRHAIWQLPTRDQERFRRADPAATAVSSRGSSCSYAFRIVDASSRNAGPSGELGRQTSASVRCGAG
jgi:hypothetical protein